MYTKYIRQFIFLKTIYKFYSKTNKIQQAMNQSYQRALNEVAMLKKALNSQKTSHQNTLQQLQTTYLIVDQMKEMLKNQQQRNKVLVREIKQKNDKIEQISRDYQDHIVNIKQLIERKDIQIKKYTQIKVTDYDMIRLRVINEIQTQHTEEFQLLKNQIKKHEFINNQSLYQRKVLKEKNYTYLREIEEFKQQAKSIEEQILGRQTKQLNKMYGLLELSKLQKKKLEKKIQQQKQKYNQTIKKYHQQLQNAQTQLMETGNGKENTRKYSNLSNNPSILQLKQSQFSLENEKLKRQNKKKSEEFEQMTKKHKSQIKQANRHIYDLEKQLSEVNLERKRLNQDIKQRILSEQDLGNRNKKDTEKRENKLKEKYEDDMQSKQKQIKRLRKQLQQTRSDAKRTFEDNPQKDQLYRLNRQNQQLKAQLKNVINQLNSAQNRNVGKTFQNRQTRAVSVQQFKEKLKAANAKIVTLIKDKISLNEKITQINKSA